MTLQQRRSPPISYGSKNVRIHFGGTWKTHLEYVDGHFTELFDLDGDFISLINLVSKWIAREPGLHGYYEWDLFLFKNGSIVHVDTERVLLDLWLKTSVDEDGFIQMFPEPKAQTVININIDELSQLAKTSQAENTQGELTQTTNPKRTPKKKRNRMGKKKLNMPEGVEALSPLPSDVDEDIPEEVLDDIPTHIQSQDMSKADVPSNIQPQEHSAHRNIDINNVDPEEEYISGSELDVEEYQGFADDIDNLYTDGELGEEVYTYMEVGKLEKGMCWPTLVEARSYLRTYAIKNHFTIHFWKNDSNRVWGICKTPGCPWSCRIYMKVDGNTCKLSKLYNKHNCRHTSLLKNKMADSRWVATTFREDIETNIDSWRPKDIQKHVWKKYGVEIGYGTAWSSRIKVLEHIYGSYEDSYKQGPEICRQVQETNPGSLATCYRDDVDNTFTSACVSFKACIQGFVEGCRPLIGLDGCFLKGKYGGVVLSATALDGNNGLFPLAIYICTSECTETWLDFLTQIMPYILLHPQKLLFISDRQKGLVNALETLFPDHPHRFCFRHMYKNFKTLYKGEHLRSLSWGMARAFTVDDHAKLISKVQKEAPAAYEWLVREDVATWSRAYFNRTSKCEHITNNFSESFNNWIRDLRDKPLAVFIDQFHIKIMKMVYDRKMNGMKMNPKGLVPRAVKTIEKYCTMMNNFRVHSSDEGLHCVVSNFSNEQRFTVDIVWKTCDCCVWDLTGIPCVHAVCILEPRKATWTDYCSEYHHVKSYQKTYGGRIVPIPDSKHWKPSQYTVLPPNLRRKPGRPPSERKREDDEQTRIPKRKRKCTICKTSGHNRARCPGGAVGSNKKVKAKVTSKTEESANKMNSRKKRNLKYSRGECSGTNVYDSGPRVPSSPPHGFTPQTAASQGTQYEGSSGTNVDGFQPPKMGGYMKVSPPNPDKYLQVRRPGSSSQPPPMRIPAVHASSQTFQISRKLVGNNNESSSQIGGRNCNDTNNNLKKLQKQQQQQWKQQHQQKLQQQKHNQKEQQQQ